ncbi:hypothetical protein [Leifsonia sp. fls2-241-R2A-40a]|uniref:hypothetical protein n=1 Tax=Leifsonia sp. fls2-241-R2A-40a TaxID=3040290 RepID=UPI00254DE863|nr:hypothetical protein [Leifsonia sp. fls2-241-R2A-40a]
MTVRPGSVVALLRVSVAAPALALALALAGCTGSSFLSPHACLPGRLSVDPAVVAAGGSVTLASGPARCDLGYERGHTYSVKVMHRQLASPPTVVEVEPSGRFLTRVVIPESFPAGDAVIVVTGSPFDRCAEEGYGSCAGYAVDITIR